MFFQLTDSLKNEILFSMEDQNTLRLLDAQECCLVEAVDQSTNENALKADNDRYYELPQWNSGDGYSLLSDFTQMINAPVIKDQLTAVLKGGRGVFRSFKNVLKQYPELDRKWHLFKNERMEQRISSWYNSLRESWGLESLEENYSDSMEDIEELLIDDFEFEEYLASRDMEDISRERNIVTDEYAQQLAGEYENRGGFSKDSQSYASLVSASAFLAEKYSEILENKQGFVCRNQNMEFSGCILWSLCPSPARNTVTLTDFFVVQNYRGLGIGKHLIENSLSLFKENGVHLAVISTFFVPEKMEPFFKSLGFEKILNFWVHNF